MRWLSDTVRSFRIALLINFCLLAVTKKAIFHRVYVEFGQNIGNHVRKRILRHLHSVDDLLVSDITLSTAEERIVMIGQDFDQYLILALGNSTTSLELIPLYEVASLQPEGFRIVSKEDARGFILAGNGRPLDYNTHKNVSFNKDAVHYGAVLSAYASLELLGKECSSVIKRSLSRRHRTFSTLIIILIFQAKMKYISLITFCYYKNENDVLNMKIKMKMKMKMKMKSVGELCMKGSNRSSLDTLSIIAMYGSEYLTPFYGIALY